MKKYLSLIGLVILFAVLPSSAFADGQDEEIRYNIWLGNERVTGSNLSGDGWSYEPESDTLTLSNAKIKGSHRGAAVYCGGQGSVIIIDGLNTAESDGVFCEGESALSYGLYLGTFDESDKKYIISGSGSLTLKGTEKSYKMPCTHSYGLYCTEPLEIGSNSTILSSGGVCDLVSCGIFVNSWYSLDIFGNLYSIAKAAQTVRSLDCESGSVNNYGTIVSATYTGNFTYESSGIYCSAIENHGSIDVRVSDGSISRAIYSCNIVNNYGTIKAVSGNARGNGENDNSSGISTNTLCTYGRSCTSIVSGSSKGGNSYGCTGDLICRGASCVDVSAGNYVCGNSVGITGNVSLYDDCEFRAKCGTAYKEDKKSIGFGGSTYDARENEEYKSPYNRRWPRRSYRCIRTSYQIG